MQATPQDKKPIAVKVRKLKRPVSELMRRHTFVYGRKGSDADLVPLANAATAAANRAGAAIEDALEFIAASNHRIAALEAQAKAKRKAA